MSIILNRPIIILENLENNNIIYLKKISSFINSVFDIINLEDIIFVNFINNNHYQFLAPNKIFIKNRINKNTIPPVTELIILKNIPNNQNNNTLKLNKKKIIICQKKI